MVATRDLNMFLFALTMCLHWHGSLPTSSRTLSHKSRVNFESAATQSECWTAARASCVVVVKHAEEAKASPRVVLHRNSELNKNSST
jgi:hypothetical protein